MSLLAAITIIGFAVPYLVEIWLHKSISAGLRDTIEQRWLTKLSPSKEAFFYELSHCSFCLCFWFSLFFHVCNGLVYLLLLCIGSATVATASPLASVLLISVSPFASAGIAYVLYKVAIGSNDEDEDATPPDDPPAKSSSQHLGV